MQQRNEMLQKEWEQLLQQEQRKQCRQKEKREIGVRENTQRAQLESEWVQLLHREELLQQSRRYELEEHEQEVQKHQIHCDTLLKQPDQITIQEANIESSPVWDNPCIINEVRIKESRPPINSRMQRSRDTEINLADDSKLVSRILDRPNNEQRPVGLGLREITRGLASLRDAPPSLPPHRYYNHKQIKRVTKAN